MVQSSCDRLEKSTSILPAILVGEPIGSRDRLEPGGGMILHLIWTGGRDEVAGAAGSDGTEWRD